MSIIAAQVRLMRFTEIPEDVIINTFSFGTQTAGAPTEGDLTAISNSILDFYQGTTGATLALASYMTNNLTDQAKHEVRLYDLSGPPGSGPIKTTFFSLATTSGTWLPTEVALCLSFKAAPVPGVPPARLRGRIYAGPFGTASLGPPVNSEARPSTGLQTSLVEAGLRLASAAGHDLSVHSRVRGQLAPVTDLWVDNAWDTQRRRGSDPTSRITRSTQV